MHFVSEASKHAKLNEVEPDIPIRRVFRKTIPSAGMETDPAEPTLECLLCPNIPRANSNRSATLSSIKSPSSNQPIQD